MRERERGAHSFLTKRSSVVARKKMTMEAAAPVMLVGDGVVQEVRDVGDGRFLLKVEVGGDKSEQGVEVNSMNYDSVMSSRWSV